VTLNRFARIAIPLNAILAAGLLLRHPAAIRAAHGWLAVAGAVVILTLYWFALHQIERTLDASLMRLGAFFGAIAAFVFAAEFLVEYTFTPRDNTFLGEVEFGLVLLMYFAAGVAACRRGQRLKDGVRASFLSATIASLIWMTALLSTSILFWGSTRQFAVLRAEGEYEDFARSGMADFQAFVVQDFLGACFYHLLLGPLIAAVLGATGSAMAITARRVFGRTRVRANLE